MLDVNIYLDTKDKKELIRLKDKYHLSFSTLANIITNIIYGSSPKGSLETHYFHNKIGNKTHIKPKTEIRTKDNSLAVTWYDYKKPSIVFTNCLNLFLKKEWKEWLKKCHPNENIEKLYEKLNNKIYQTFDNTWDENWNGNQLSRFIPKFIKQNPEYTRKLLNIE